MLSLFPLSATPRSLFESFGGEGTGETDFSMEAVQVGGWAIDRASGEIRVPHNAGWSAGRAADSSPARKRWEL